MSSGGSPVAHASAFGPTGAHLGWPTAATAPGQGAAAAPRAWSGGGAPGGRHGCGAPSPSEAGAAAADDGAM
ncbi:hypothetical protein U9M48_037329 [Paspalum notatum var. saurae]|uniref:Uncharacterized protein n=1 Tax=Paspalum notatum var. saurae TaxID=547442 RepID=A0AAQ3X961_PASNO